MEAVVQQLQQDLAVQNQNVLNLQAQLANQRRIGSHKIDKFTNESGADDWIVFKRHFLNTCQLNGFQDQEMRRALAAAMAGKAALAVLDVDVNAVDEGGNQITINDVLDIFESRFLPEASSQIARINFDAARQGATENVLNFHSRLRSLYNRAYPNAADQTNLIRRFIMGLRRRELRVQCMRNYPQTYPDALQVAQNEASVMQMVKVTELGAAPAEEPMEIGAIQPPGQHPPPPPRQGNPRNTNCHFCGRQGHWKRECELLKRARRFNGNGGGRGRGGGGRGGGGPPGGFARGGGPGGGRGRAGLVAALEAALDDYEEPNNDHAEEEAPEQEAQEAAEGDF